MSTDEHNLNDDLGMFEAAVRAKPVTLTVPECQSIVTFLDASNQDETVRGFAHDIASGHNAITIHETVLPEADVTKILALANEKQADLVIVPVPFGRDIDKLKDESLGSVIDMLLQELKKPLLCVRQPMDKEQQAAALGEVLIPILSHEEGHAHAVSWAFRLVVREGKLELTGVADQNVIDEAKQLLELKEEALQSDVLMRAVMRDLGELVSAAQKQGMEQSVSVQVEVKVGSPVKVILEQANDRPRLLVTSTSRDHKTLSFHQTHDLILGATGPVLVV